jgi:hypothetical protein
MASLFCNKSVLLKLEQSKHPAGALRRGFVLEVMPLRRAWHVGACVDEGEQIRVWFRRALRQGAQSMHVAGVVHNAEGGAEPRAGGFLRPCVAAAHKMDTAAGDVPQVAERARAARSAEAV